MAEDIVFRACRTCGKYMAIRMESKQVYCSPECSQIHSKCSVCGKWFPTDQGSQGLCSEECAKTYPEKLLLFKELE